MQFDAERWLRQQGSRVHDLFETAAKESRDNGIQLLLGSSPPTLEELECSRQITILPLRFLTSSGKVSLSLSLLATIEGGPSRYAVIVDAIGQLPVQALRKLILEHEEIWEKAYLRTGLWIGKGANTRLLNNASQIIESDGDGICITGVFLHSDLSRTIQQGVMVLGLLYRSILDELSDAGKMRRLYAQLTKSLDSGKPRFQRIIHP
jgi:hypothetical protein